MRFPSSEIAVTFGVDCVLPILEFASCHRLRYAQPFYINVPVNFASQLHDHGVELIDLQDEESIRLMSDFISHNPKIWMEDIGHS